MKILSSFFLVLALFCTSNAYAADETSQQVLLKDAKIVMEEIMSAPDLGVPSGILSRAQAVIVFPGMLKGGFFIGARYGKGVATVRDSKTGQWGPPSFITTLGGSFGFQIGAESVDMVLIVMTEKGIKGILNNNFTLGGDLAVTAGPVGRHMEMGVDILLQGDMYSYSRSKGVFGGVSLKGTIIKQNVAYNESHYNEKLTPEEIMIDGKVKNVPESSRKFLDYMNQIAPEEKPSYESSEWMAWTDDPKYGFEPQPKVVAQNMVSQEMEVEVEPAPKPEEEYHLPLW
jgi:lipid-binding SYLF domain-containing protein